jgi:LysR family transcriptional regulator, low CO2-responsive transcriptional regulator
MRIHRNVRRHLDLAYTEHLLSALQRHDLDVVLVTSPPQNGKFTSQCVEKNPLMIVAREGHPLARSRSVSLSDLVTFPWIFFHRSVHSWLHDQILRRAEFVGGGIRIVHRVNHSEQVPQLLKDDTMLAWLSPAGAEHIARLGLVAIPLDDPEIHLETHLVALADNSSPLVAEYFRCFLAQIERDHSPVQLTLPLAVGIAPQNYSAGIRRVSGELHLVHPTAQV